MARNGPTGERFSEAFRKRTVPHTGITLKMLASKVGVSDQTLARYRDNRSSIPAAAILDIDKAFKSFGVPGFLDEVVEGASVRPVTIPERLEDHCYWATHMGGIMRAPMGHGDMARRFLGKSFVVGEDWSEFVMRHYGWIGVTHYFNDRMVLTAHFSSIHPLAALCLMEWLDGLADQVIESDLLPQKMSAKEVSAWLRPLADQE